MRACGARGMALLYAYKGRSGGEWVAGFGGDGGGVDGGEGSVRACGSSLVTLACFLQPSPSEMPAVSF